MISISYVYCEKTSSLRCQWSNSSIGPKKKRIMISVMEWNNAKKIRKYYVVLTRKSCSHSQLGPVQLRRSQPSCLLLSFLVLLFVCRPSFFLLLPILPLFLKSGSNLEKKLGFRVLQNPLLASTNLASLKRDHRIHQTSDISHIDSSHLNH